MAEGTVNALTQAGLGPRKQGSRRASKHVPETLPAWSQGSALRDANEHRLCRFVWKQAALTPRHPSPAGFDNSPCGCTQGDVRSAGLPVAVGLHNDSDVVLDVNVCMPS
eukprot:365043-Chlamydomonas_euryale.AAC.22